MRTMYHTRLYSHSVCVCNNEWCTACFCMHTRVCDNKSRAAGSCARACALRAQEKTCTRKIRLKWNNENLETARCITAMKNTLCLTGLRNSLNVFILISGHSFSWDAPILLFNFYCVFLCRFLHIAHVLVFLCRMRVFVHVYVHVCVPSHCLFVCMCFCVLKWCINVDVLMKPLMLRGDLLMACLRVRACVWMNLNIFYSNDHVLMTWCCVAAAENAFVCLCVFACVLLERVGSEWKHLSQTSEVSFVADHQHDDGNIEPMASLLQTRTSDSVCVCWIFVSVCVVCFCFSDTNRWRLIMVL